MKNVKIITKKKLEEEFLPKMELIKLSWIKTREGVGYKDDSVVSFEKKRANTQRGKT